MKKCTNCGKEYEDVVQVCDECGTELTEFSETQTEAQEVKEEDASQNTVLFCVYCGGQIEPEKGYCVKCGKSSIEEGKRHCIGCGEELLENQKFCAKCGHKVNNIVVPKSLDNAAEKIKNVSSKKIKIGAIVVGAIVALILIGKTVLPKILVSTEEYLAEGNYKKAYEKASKKEKEDVLVENLIASICATAKEGLKDEDSFKLRDAWYVKDDDRIVIEVQGTNSYGGEVTSYWYYTFSSEDEEYQLWTTVSDFDEEETYSWDEFEDKLEVILNNSAKEAVREIINDKDAKLDDSLVKRINGLKNKDILDDVELLEETKTLYPVDEESEGV